MLTELEKKIIASVQEDMAVAERPYLKIAQNLGITETQLLEKLKDLCNREVIRRFGATLRHQRTGFTANAMVAWKVDEDRIEAVGQLSDRKWLLLTRYPTVTAATPAVTGRITCTPWYMPVMNDHAMQPLLKCPKPHR
jgi:DNA-binding Lrp family transcriptional regulator